MPEFLFLLTVFLLGLASPAWSQEQPPVEVVVVVGKQPGPPLWRVSHGENTLWIMGLLTPMPRDMIWDTNNVETVLADAQEYLGLPATSFSVSPLTALNPINITRGLMMVREVSRLPDERPLEQSLPKELYARYAVLKQDYFPRNEKLEKKRPFMVGMEINTAIYDKLGLSASPHAITRRLDRLARRAAVPKTEIVVEQRLEGKFSDLLERIRDLLGSIPLPQEVACLDVQIQRLEEELEDAVHLANAWAAGYADELKYVDKYNSQENACTALLYDTEEAALIRRTEEELKLKWLNTAENALQNNRSTFAVLDMVELISPSGLLSILASKGYAVREP